MSSDDPISAFLALKVSMRMISVAAMWRSLVVPMLVSQHCLITC